MTKLAPAARPEKVKVKVKLFAPVDDEFDRIMRRSNRWAAATAAIVLLGAVINVVLIVTRA